MEKNLKKLWQLVSKSIYLRNQLCNIFAADAVLPMYYFLITVGKSGTNRFQNVSPVYLACADVFSEAFLCDSHLQVRVVLPGVSVGRVLPAAGPGRQLDTWQQEAQAHRHLQLSDGRTATPWRRKQARRRKRVEGETGMGAHRPPLSVKKEMHSPSVSHFLKASSIASPGPGLDTHTNCKDLLVFMQFDAFILVLFFLFFPAGYTK